MHVVIKKHKYSGRDGVYVTEMTASEPLAKLLRPVIFSTTSALTYVACCITSGLITAVGHDCFDTAIFAGWVRMCSVRKHWQLPAPCGTQ